MKRFCARLSHNLNNCAGIIQGYVDLMKLDLEPESECFGYLDRILQACHKLTDMSRSFETFAETRSLPLLEVNLRELAEPLLTSGEELRVELERAPLIAGHPESLRQAVGELLKNAREADQSPPTLAIYERDGAICLDVTNGGEEPTLQTQECAFDPYFSTRGLNRGLGLSRVHGIICCQGGQIEMKPGTNYGNTMTITFSTAPSP